MFPFGNSVWHVLHNLNYLLRVPILVIAIYVICAINSKRVLRQESVKERKLHTLEQLNFDQLWKCRLSWSELRFHSRGLNMCVSVTYTCCVWLFSQFQPFGVQKPQKNDYSAFCSLLLFCFCDFMTLLCFPGGPAGCSHTHNKQVQWVICLVLFSSFFILLHMAFAL